jgi:hypothetical protein
VVLHAGAAERAAGALLRHRLVLERLIKDIEASRFAHSIPPTRRGMPPIPTPVGLIMDYR